MCTTSPMRSADPMVCAPSACSCVATVAPTVAVATTISAVTTTRLSVMKMPSSCTRGASSDASAERMYSTLTPRVSAAIVHEHTRRGWKEPPGSSGGGGGGTGGGTDGGGANGG